MTEPHDAVDGMRARLATLYPDLDTSGFAVTGRVLRLARAIDRHRADHLAESDLSPGDFDVLATVRRLEGDEGVNPRRVLQSVLITSGGLTKRLDRLEASGLLARHPDPDDRRGTRVRLTEQGRITLDGALRSLLDAERVLVGRALGDEDTGRLADLLRRLATQVDAEGV